jgi:lactate permease
MSVGALSFLALLPILSVFILIVIFRLPATRAMPVAFILVCFLAFFVWQTPLLQITAFPAASISQPTYLQKEDLGFPSGK